MARFRDTEEFGPTVDTVAERLDISATAVEKDYWASEVLRVLAATFPDDFIFKGGTSLSKGYRIVERFSEDIDVLVLPGQRGRGAVDKLMRAMGEVAGARVGGEATGIGGAESGHRSFAVSYPARREPTALLATSVLLEMGVRGGPQPHERVGIGCLLGDALGAAGTDLADYEDLAPFEVTVLHPARTLLEKLVHVHEVAIQLGADEARPAPPRSGRHLYDVYQLLGDDRVLACCRTASRRSTSSPTSTRSHTSSSAALTGLRFGPMLGLPAARPSTRLRPCRAGSKRPTNRRCQSSTSGEIRCRRGRASAVES